MILRLVTYFHKLPYLAANILQQDLEEDTKYLLANKTEKQVVKSHPQSIHLTLECILNLLFYSLYCSSCMHYIRVISSFRKMF